jgi:hypothetical protein
MRTRRKSLCFSRYNILKRPILRRKISLIYKALPTICFPDLKKSPECYSRGSRFIAERGVFMRTIQSLLLAAACSGLVGCLDSAKNDAAPATSVSQDAASEVTMSSVSLDMSCNNGKQGTIVYDQAKGSFFFCNQGIWIAVNLTGQKGDKGDKGDTGATGPAGTPGAPGTNGTNGVNGTNGRDGLDGDGVRLALKDGTDVKGLLIQYDWSGGGQMALMMLPSGDMIYIDVNTGYFAGKPWAVYYTEANCTGDGYTGRSDAQGPHTAGRIYVGSDNSGVPVAYYHADEWVNTNISYKSYRDYDTSGQMNYCKNYVSSTRVLVRVSSMVAPASLKYLAPIHFSP